MKSSALLKILVAVIAIAFMGYYLYKNWSDLQQYHWQFNLFLFLISILILWLALFAIVLIFKLIFKKLINVDIGFLQMFRAYNISNIGRYLPGKVWSIFGLFYFTGQYGINKKQTTLAIIANEVSYKGSGALLGLCYFLFSSSFQNYLPLMIALLVACLVVIHPRILDKIINLALKLIKKQPIEMDFSYSTIFVFFLMYIIVWEIHSLAFYVLVNSITSLESVNIFKFSTILPLCWVVGYIILLTPGGIGVREGMLVITLGEFLTPEVALVVAILQRIWFILVEGINVLISFAIQVKTNTR
jgi:uncharacterized membrane protein YbhN (UPF0104 family)